MKKSLICNHLNKNIEIPCVLLIEPEPYPNDYAGRIFLCQECASKPPEESLSAANVIAVCEEHLDAMTIVHTADFSKTIP